MPGGGGGTSQPSPSVYQPKYQDSADSSLQSLFQPLQDQALAGLSATGGVPPAASVYPQVQNAAQNIVNNPYNPQALQGAQAGAGLYGSAVPTLQPGIAGMASAGQNLLSGAGNVLNTAFDPQNALYNRTQQKVLDASNVARSMAGVAGTPYGAGLNTKALSDFNIDWQNQLLNRELAGLSGAGTAATTGGNLYGAGNNLAGALSSGLTSTAGLPASTYASQQNQGLGALNNQVALGNGIYALPQSVIGDLQSYMTGGLNAAQVANSVQDTQFKQEAQSSQGLANTITGLPGAIKDVASLASLANGGS